MSELCPPGKYNSTFVSAVATNNHFQEPELQIEVDIEGCIRTVKVRLDDKWIDNSLRQLAAIGFNNDFKNPVFTVKEFPVECWHSKPNDKGRVYENWALPKIAAAPMDDDLAARLSARARAVSPPPAPAGRPTPPPPAAAPAPTGGPPPVSDNSKPFKSPPQPCTRDEAWKGFTGLCNGDETAAGKLWSAAIADVTKSIGRPESTFTPTDWGLVVREVIPWG